jgi:hypothetical protein
MIENELQLRIARLERFNRLLLVVVVIALILPVGLAFQDAVPQSLTVSSLKIVSPKSNKVITMGIGENGGQILIKDNQGNTSVWIDGDSQAPAITIGDKGGYVQLTAGLNRDGRVELRDKKEKWMYDSDDHKDKP